MDIKDTITGENWQLKQQGQKQEGYSEREFTITSFFDPNRKTVSENKEFVFFFSISF